MSDGDNNLSQSQRKLISPKIIVDSGSLSDSSDGGIETSSTVAAKKGPMRRRRTIISQEELKILEDAFFNDHWPSRSKKGHLAMELNKSELFVNTWFQNKRARLRRTEDVDLQKPSAFKEEPVKMVSMEDSEGTKYLKIIRVSPSDVFGDVSKNKLIDKPSLVRAKTWWPLSNIEQGNKEGSYKAAESSKQQSNSKILDIGKGLKVVKTPQKPTRGVADAESSNQWKTNQTVGELENDAENQSATKKPSLVRANTWWPLFNIEQGNNEGSYKAAESSNNKKSGVMKTKSRWPTKGPENKDETSRATISGSLITDVQANASSDTRTNISEKSIVDPDAGDKNISLFEAVIKIVAVGLGGIINGPDEVFHSTIDDYLYGINVNGDTRIFYDKKLGVKMVPMADLSGSL